MSGTAIPPPSVFRTASAIRNILNRHRDLDR
jgi:hypothetical protein